MFLTPFARPFPGRPPAHRLWRIGRTGFPALACLLALTACEVEIREPGSGSLADTLSSAAAVAPDRTTDPNGQWPVEIVTARAPEAIGPYSQAIRVGNTVYLSGQIALDPETGEIVDGGIEAETRQVMENLRAVLEAAGAEFGHVVQTQVFLADLEDFGTMNEIYAGYLSQPAPARATIQAARLPRDARVEIMMTAVIP
ncbi:MAG: RidA family protein [Gemmatimonadales bacterium]|nr:MAG: RidA family protein [Gemmatimonadales bacterium]